MATKLKGLEVGKVDFVDEGANQRADIKLLKGKNKAEETSDPEIGLFKRFLNWIGGEVQKSATTFDEQMKSGLYVTPCRIHLIQSCATQNWTAAGSRVQWIQALNSSLQL